jgi:acetyl-CoA carboxylase carboxyltransferase component
VDDESKDAATADLMMAIAKMYAAVDAMSIPVTIDKRLIPLANVAADFIPKDDLSMYEVRVVLSRVDDGSLRVYLYEVSPFDPKK